MTSKTDARYRLTFGTKLRLFLRVLALTGFVCFVVGAFLVGPIWKSINLETAVSSFIGENGQSAQIATYLMGGGAIVVLLWAIVAFFSILFSSTGGRSALRVNSVIQTTLAIALLLGINLYSFQHYERWDVTRDKQFTLPKNLVEELKKLRGDTQIVVLQQHKTFGQLSTRPDGFDYAAERKVVEKVKDLVDLFREIRRPTDAADGNVSFWTKLFGESQSQFPVTILDVEDESFDTRFKELTEKRPLLAEAIKAAPENSIFFYANDKVQRLSFNEFYQLNKTASKEKKNLVLQPQGIETFSRRILAIEEKKPKVALCVIHDWLGSRSDFREDLTHSGLRKSLELNGFEVVDVILKKWDVAGPNPEPAAYSPDEYRVDELREELVELRTDLNELDEQKTDLQKFIEALKKPTPEFREFLRRRFNRDLTDTEMARQIDALQDDVKANLEQQAELRKEEEQLQKSLSKLEADDKLSEARRMTEVSPKLRRILDECDLLVVPRTTAMNLPRREVLSPEYHTLDYPTDGAGSISRQVAVMKAFMKRGKPVLAAIGPNFEIPFNRGGEPLPPGYSRLTGGLTRPLDGFEQLLIDCGVEPSQQIVLYDKERKSFSAVRVRSSLGGASGVNLPPVEFSGPLAKGQKPNPIGAALTFTGQSVAQPLDIRLRHPRPIYLSPGLESKLPFAAEFLYTSADTWNESSPFGTVRQRDARTAQLEPPRFNATRNQDPKKGTREEERRGPFPIGVALQMKVPIEWYDDKYQKEILLDGKAFKTPSFSELRGLSSLPGLMGLPEFLTPAVTVLAQNETQQVRLAVIGQGGVFTGKELSPATEKLLLYSCNWLLGRDEKLPQTNLPEWSYPRVTLEEKEKFYWRWGTFIGLPMLATFLGLLVLLFRRVR